ncbi:MAG: efflux RND transporter periplasmic adaptor subunit, partial [Deltaproteobacteria bacterium]|nr:efflux RND transporter periplasmic adaptor subunit [Deltaproteobacteria bacterium]
SRREAKILARLAGSLTVLPAAEGAKVKEGQIVARLATPDLRQRAKRLVAERSRAELEATFLCEQQGIDAKLVAKNAIPRTRLDSSSHRCKSSKKALAAAKAGLAEFGATQRKSTERAPFAGWVLKHLAEAGENVFPGKPVLLLGGEQLEVRVKVSERDMARGIRLGSKVLVRRPHGAKREATVLQVSRIAPMAAGPGRIAEVGIAVPRDAAIKPLHGASIDVAFVLREEEAATAVPLRAVRSGSAAGNAQNKATLYVVEEGIAKAKQVTLGVAEKGWISISPALKPSSQVVVSNLDVVREGMALYPVLDPGVGAP